MPELPEVETVRLGLEKYVVGLTIKDIEIRHPKPFVGDKAKVLNSKIVLIRRIGKGLILDLSNGFSLAIHIKMTGQLVFRDEKTKNVLLSPKVGTLPNKFTHVIFHLYRHPELVSGSNGIPGHPPAGEAGARNDSGVESLLYYNDMRRFGWIKVIRTDDVSNLSFFKQMGPEPFAKKFGSGQADLSLKTFQGIVSKPATRIKQLIMDQAKIGGIGNIYANDALFEAKIDPRRPAKSLKNKEIRDLYDSIVKVLEKSLKEGGASELSFVNILGQEGNYQNHTLVYGKKGKSCPRRDGIIQRISLGGRGTFFCTGCQK